MAESSGINSACDRSLRYAWPQRMRFFFYATLLSGAQAVFLGLTEAQARVKCDVRFIFDMVFPCYECCKRVYTNIWGGGGGIIDAWDA